jgi:hypothetical protein
MGGPPDAQGTVFIAVCPDFADRYFFDDLPDTADFVKGMANDKKSPEPD